MSSRIKLAASSAFIASESTEIATPWFGFSMHQFKGRYTRNGRRDGVRAGAIPDNYFIAAWATS